MSTLSSVPPIVMLAPETFAVVMTGKFCRLFAPPSPSPASFAVTPVGGSPACTRLIPSAPLEWSEFPSTAMPLAAASISTPL